MFCFGYFFVVFRVSLNSWYRQQFFMCTPKSWIGNVGAGNKGSHGGNRRSNRYSYLVEVDLMGFFRWSYGAPKKKLLGGEIGR